MVPCRAAPIRIMAPNHTAAVPTRLNPCRRNHPVWTGISEATHHPTVAAALASRSAGVTVKVPFRRRRFNAAFPQVRRPDVKDPRAHDVASSYSLWERANRVIPGGSQLISRRPYAFANGWPPCMPSAARARASGMTEVWSTWTTVCR